MNSEVVRHRLQIVSQFEEQKILQTPSVHLEEAGESLETSISLSYLKGVNIK